MKYKIEFVVVCLFWLVQNSYAQITVACAANVQFAMEEIKKVAEKSGIFIKPIYGSSGKLTSQIKNGAPFDIFISADVNHPDSLYKSNFAISQPRVYSYGKLVLWSTKKLKLDPQLKTLNDKRIKKIAIPDPKHAPYGRESMRAIKNAGVLTVIVPKLVYGESVAQTAQYIQTGVVDIGFNAKSVVVAGPKQKVGSWAELDTSLYNPIAQAAVILRYGQENNPELSKKFYDFLFSKEAQMIFLKYGYSLPK